MHHRVIYFALGLMDRIPRRQDQLYLMKQVELVHKVDKAKKKRKRKRERQEKKVKKTSPSPKKIRVSLDTMVEEKKPLSQGEDMHTGEEAL